MGWDVPYLKRSGKSEFIHLKGRVWTEPSAVIDEGRYGVAGDQKHSRSQDDTEKLAAMDSDGRTFSPGAPSESFNHIQQDDKLDYESCTVYSL